MADVIRRVEAEAIAAKALLAAIAEIIGDDEQAAADAVEGETSLVEAVDASLARIAELRALQIGLEAHVKAMQVRLARVSTAEDFIRSCLHAALKTTGLRKLERPLATISIRAGTPSVEITDIEALPVWLKRFRGWEPDKVAVRAAIKDVGSVPGARMTDAGETLSIRGL